MHLQSLQWSELFLHLSRPWRPYAQAVFIRCELGKHILPVGWNNWGKKENENTVFYAEYESRGEGANPKARAAFSQQLKNLQGYEITTVLAGEDGWSPVADGNKLITVKRWLDEYVKKWITKQKTMDI